MKKEALEEAIFEARRFISAAEKALATVKTERVTHTWRGEPMEEIVYRSEWNGVDSAACKRASLDLTRKLSELRGNK